MSINSPEQFEKLRACGMIVGKALRAMAVGVRAGVTTAELCEIGSRVLAEHGAQSSPPMVGADEAGTLQAFKAIRAELLDPTIAAHNGRLVKTTGDGLLVEFSSVVDALRCATEVQTRNGRAKCFGGERARPSSKT